MRGSYPRDAGSNPASAILLDRPDLDLYPFRILSVVAFIKYMYWKQFELIVYGETRIPVWVYDLVKEVEKKEG